MRKAAAAMEIRSPKANLPPRTGCKVHSSCNAYRHVPEQHTHSHYVAFVHFETHSFHNGPKQHNHDCNGEQKPDNSGVTT